MRLLFRNRLDPAEDLAGTQLPVAIVAAGRDTLILPARTDALRGAVPNPVFDRTIPEAGHNDIYDHPAFRGTMAQALQTLR